MTISKTAQHFRWEKLPEIRSEALKLENGATMRVRLMDGSELDATWRVRGEWKGFLDAGENILSVAAVGILERPYGNRSGTRAKPSILLSAHQDVLDLWKLGAEAEGSTRAKWAVEVLTKAAAKAVGMDVDEALEKID